MTREEFDVLVQRVEAGVGRRPAALRLRVAWFAGVAYAGLLAGLFVVLLISGIAFGAMLFAGWEGRVLLALVGAGVLFGGGSAVLRALWVRLPPPEGRAVTPAEAPALHAALEELRVALRAAPFHHVLVVPPCNAAVVQVLRFGVLGWSRNYLLLGLPLLEGFAPGELRAVLAHEFAHLSKAHGRFGHWIYRLRRSWERVFQHLSRPRHPREVSLRPLIGRFFGWVWPRFNAYAFVLSRANEYEADAVAARLAGAEQMESALCRLALYDRVLDDTFWPKVWEEANAQPTPPEGVFLRLGEALQRGLAAPEAAKCLEEACRLITTNADTHPCLTERLRALGRLQAEPSPARHLMAPPPPQPSAAEVFLGPALASIRQAVEQQWRKECEPRWRERHARATALHHRLAQINQAVSADAADPDGLWDRARVLLDLHGDEDERIEPLLRQILALRPLHVGACFHLGRLLLEANRPEGEELLERAMAEDVDVVPQACRLLHDYYRRAGRTDDLRRLRARLDQHEKDLVASRAERNTVQASDPLLPHGLTPAELAALVERLAAEPEVVGADLGRKDLRHFVKQRLFLLSVRIRRPWHGYPDRDRAAALVQRLSSSIHLPGRVLVFAPMGGFRALGRKLHALPDAAVYRRGNMD